MKTYANLSTATKCTINCFSTNRRYGLLSQKTWSIDKETEEQNKKFPKVSKVENNNLKVNIARVVFQS